MAKVCAPFLFLSVQCSGGGGGGNGEETADGDAALRKKKKRGLLTVINPFPSTKTV